MPEDSAQGLAFSHPPLLGSSSTLHQTGTRPQTAMPLLASVMGLAGLLFWTGHTVGALRMPNTTLVLGRPKNVAVWPLSGLGVPRYRRKRHISARDMSALLGYHNHIRASVHPPAANMEYMVSPRPSWCIFQPTPDCSLWLPSDWVPLKSWTFKAAHLA